jgi:hypothetical protein
MVDEREVEWLRKSSKVRDSKEIVSLTGETSTDLVSLSHSFERIKIWEILLRYRLPPTQIRGPTLISTTNHQGNFCGFNIIITSLTRRFIAVSLNNAV